ncbi:glycosyltransferase family 4 protein [Ramlibacter sp. PS3R-8]|uniref:glycosyltransferase family 4 protein n=1 Tax=Ramlibacter sp. PS3R-8 TaxID=3133437 RepID=UPI0030A8DC64
MPKVLRKAGFGGWIRYVSGNGRVLLNCVAGLLRERGSRLHVTSFYGNSIYLEAVYVAAALCLRRQTVLELRAGGVVEFYQQGHWIYRAVFRFAVSRAHSVLVQGSRYLDFLRKLIPHAKIYHYPNFLLNSEFIQRAEQGLPRPPLRLIYFGRISAAKNIEFILEICTRLNVDFTCDIIGSGSPDYIAHVRGLIATSQLGGRVRVLPPADRPALQELLSHQHFFLFPTREPREGHSNALNEAMAAGVVPVASNFGFNEEVLGNSSLIVRDWSPDAYAAVIESIWMSGDWVRVSEELRRKARSEFSEGTAQKILSAAYCGTF